MCYDFKVSITAFVTATVSGIVAIYFRQPILGALILCYGLMQLSELLVWRGIDTQNRKLNKIGTAIGKYTLPTHNIAIGIGVAAAYWAYRKKFTTWIPLIVGIIFYISVLIWYSKHPSKSDITEACDYPSGDDRCTKDSARLIWPYTHSYYYASFAISILIFGFYVRPFFPTGIIVGAFFILTLLTTAFLGKIQVQGSFWCWSTAILAPFLVLLTTFVNRNRTVFS